MKGHQQTRISVVWNVIQTELTQSTITVNFLQFHLLSRLQQTWNCSANMDFDYLHTCTYRKNWTKPQPLFHLPTLPSSLWVRMDALPEHGFPTTGFQGDYDTDRQTQSVGILTLWRFSQSKFQSLIKMSALYWITNPIIAHKRDWTANFNNEQQDSWQNKCTIKQTGVVTSVSKAETEVFQTLSLPKPRFLHCNLTVFWSVCM